MIKIINDRQVLYIQLLGLVLYQIMIGKDLTLVRRDTGIYNKWPTT